ncbi:MAG TPA: hypothetical protein VFW87_21890 [Pirellulales bacterium]|nr:hypothetical protein [Pirellulales bacterium]
MGRTFTELNFEEWLRFVFDHPVTDPQWYFDIDADEWRGTSSIAADYLTRLFSDPCRWCEGFSDEQLNQGFWFIVGQNGCHGADSFLDAEVPWEIRRQGIEAIGTLFEQLFAKRCSDRLSHFDERGVRPLNSICYMWWDLFPTFGPSRKPSQASFDAVAMEVMRRLLEIDSQACQESALHGLGHYQSAHPTRVKRMIDEYLARNPELRRELLVYAHDAREGVVL